MRMLFTRFSRRMGRRVSERCLRPQIVFLGLATLYSSALLIGPLRRRIAAVIDTKGLLASPQSIIPIVAIALAIVIILLQFRIYSSRQLQFYVKLTALIIALFMCSTFSQEVISEAFAFAMILSIVAAVVWYAVISTQERQLLFEWAILMFFIYLIVNLVYWVLVLNPLENPSPGMPFKRMGGSLATVVHIGVLIPALCAFGLALPETKRSRWTRPTMICIALLALIATGSRSGCCLMGVLLVIVVFSDSAKSVKILSSIALTAILVVALSGVVADYRYFTWNLSGGGRMDSWRVARSYWKGVSPSELFFGAGWGRIYPYWSWLSEGAQTWDGLNTFVLGSSISLVSPHNCFVWILVEGGLLIAIAIGLFCVYPAFRILKRCRNQRKHVLIFGWLSLMVLILISDVLVTDPGTGFLVFTLLLLAPDCP